MNLFFFSFFMVQERIGKGVCRFNDPVVHRPYFFRALDNGVKKGHLSVSQARELRRNY